MDITFQVTVQYCSSPKQKQCSVEDVSGGECKEQYCIITCFVTFPKKVAFGFVDLLSIDTVVFCFSTVYLFYYLWFFIL